MDVRINKAHVNNIKGDFEKSSSLILRVLYVLTTLSIVSQLAHNAVFPFKAALIFLISVWISRETEIFFQTMKSNISRSEAKEMLKTTKPEITGLIYALLLPVGTPLFVVAAGAFVAIFIGKMVFGGYSYNVFNPAIVGRLFVSIAWPSLVTISFPKTEGVLTLDNYLLSLIFEKDLTIPLLSPLMELSNNGVVYSEGMKTVTNLLFSPQLGMLFAMPAIIYIGLILLFFIRKTVDLRPLLLTLLSTAVVLSVITLGFKLDMHYAAFHLLAGGFLFVTLFMMSDPFTKPYSNIGMLYYAVIFTVVYSLIRFIGKDADGVLYALLFANLFVPLLNKKTVKATFTLSLKNTIMVVLLITTLIGTGLFIKTILEQRIESKESVVGVYDKK